LPKNIFRKRHEEVKTDRYLLTYADLITLLLGLFIILYASSKIDSEKYKEVSSAFSKYFKVSDKQSNTAGKGTLQGQKNGIPEPIMPYTKGKSIDDIYSETSEALKDQIDKGTVELKLFEGGVKLIFPEKMLFLPGNADIQTGGISILDSLALVLKGIQQEITIDGHTDATPMSGVKFPSNWHLSLARSMNTAYELIKKGIPENNLVIRGFGAQRPVSDNQSEEGRMLNRRVEITISELPANAPSKEAYKKADSANK
jgi:chemotaxis protein MotB